VSGSEGGSFVCVGPRWILDDGRDADSCHTWNMLTTVEMIKCVGDPMATFLRCQRRFGNTLMTVAAVDRMAQASSEPTARTEDPQRIRQRRIREIRNGNKITDAFGWTTSTSSRVWRQPGPPGRAVELREGRHVLGAWSRLARVRLAAPVLDVVTRDWAAEVATRLPSGRR
jgi:hypothetical protein